MTWDSEPSEKFASRATNGRPIFDAPSIAAISFGPSAISRPIGSSRRDDNARRYVAVLSDTAPSSREVIEPLSVATAGLFGTAATCRWNRGTMGAVDLVRARLRGNTRSAAIV